jgi:CDP-alcohol phosphatidyltransferase
MNVYVILCTRSTTTVDCHLHVLCGRHTGRHVDHEQKVVTIISIYSIPVSTRSLIISTAASAMMYSCVSLILILQLLLASSMASSFATISSASFRQRRLVGPKQPHNASYSSIFRGGSTPHDEENPQPPPVAVAEESTSQSIPTVESASEAALAASDEQVLPKHTRLGPKAPPPGFIRQQFPAVPWHAVPNWLTFGRCLTIPFFTVLFYAPGNHVATATLFAVASLTDYLDGYLARRWDISSAFGAFLDPVVR